MTNEEWLKFCEWRDKFQSEWLEMSVQRQKELDRRERLERKSKKK